MSKSLKCADGELLLGVDVGERSREFRPNSGPGPIDCLIDQENQLKIAVGCLIDRLTKTRSRKPGASGPVDRPKAGARLEG